MIRNLLQHVGSMCLHQLHNDLLHTPLGAYILQQHPLDVTYLQRVCDILEQAVTVDDRQTMICALIILQVALQSKNIITHDLKEKKVMSMDEIL